MRERKINNEKGKLMKCLSLHQPQATLMALGLKKIETRCWKTSYRGPLVIHAAKKIELRPNLAIQFAIQKAGFLPQDLPQGVLLCIGELIECRKITLHNRPEMPELAFGNYTPGRYMWIFKDMSKLIEPIPYRGMQRIFNIPNNFLFGRIPNLNQEFE